MNYGIIIKRASYSLGGERHDSGGSGESNPGACPLLS